MVWNIDGVFWVLFLGFCSFERTLVFLSRDVGGVMSFYLLICVWFRKGKV